MPNTDERLSRSHVIHESRSAQIALNLKAVAGGRPYIDARLARLPYESDVSWGGKGREGGRSARAFLINYAGRIAAKINQYVFSTAVQRDNADPVFIADTTRTGLSITEVMAQVSRIVTAARWCWISVDRNSLPRDAAGNPLQRSVAAKEASGDRVFWSVWNPQEVVDWHFGANGKLSWVMTEQEVYNNSDPMVPAVKQSVRTLWMKGGGTRLWLDPNDHKKLLREEQFTSSLDEISFVPVGYPCACPWWFDDVENIQSSLLNLDSVHGENLFQTVFPQLVLPDGMIQTMMDQLKISGDGVMNMVRGLGYPILEAQESSGQTRYLVPGGGLDAIPRESLRRRKELFEIVGLALQHGESKMIASAESKAWDHLDAEQVLRERATLLEEVETKAVLLSKRLDPTFPEYTPVYSKTFNIRDIKDDLAALLEVDKLPLPVEAKKEIKRAAISVVSRMLKIPDDRMSKIMAEIDAAG